MKLSVSKRIWRGFLLILVIMVLIGTMSIVAMNKLKSELSFLIDDRVYKVELTNDLINSQKERYIAISSYVIFKTAEFVEQRDTSTAQSEQIMKKINQAFSEAEHSKLLAEINELHTQFNEMVDTISYQLMRVNETQNRVALKETALLNAELMEKATELKQYQQDAMEQSIQEHEQIVHLLLLFVIVAMGIGIVLALLLSNRISKRIGDPVHQLTGALQEIAKGNFLVEPIHVKEEDEIGLMANSFNRMVEDVRKLLDKIRTASEQLAAQSEELSASSQESLASSETISTAAEQNIVMSEKQSQIVSQTNDAIARLSTDVDQIATSNSTMLQSMQTVVNHIQNGSTSIAKLTEQMNETNTTIGQAAKIIQSMADQSYQIQHVTALITDISEQTNLLALNAAIEAARAGEHGKGFAVVAEEVRKLAEQSKKSATEIGDMIVAIQTATEQAVQAIEAGSTSVNLGHDATHETSTSFQEIKHSVQTVHTNVQQVAHSIHEIHEMSSTIQQASKEIQELAESATSTAQQSSAATEEQLAVNEEISSSSQTLASLAENLQQEIKRFSF